MAESDAVVRVYDPDAESEAIIKVVQRSGVALNKLSIVGKDYHIAGSVIGYHNAADRMKVWGELGNYWGGLSVVLMGSAFYFIPGIGPVIVFGPLVKWIVSALEGGVMTGELSALGAGLHGIGIAKHSIMQYETALKGDKFIVIAHGAPDDLAQAESVRENAGAAQLVAII
jgi:hypothetical protein